MNKRKYIMSAMIIIGVLSILEWGISFSSIFLIVSMALIYIVFSMRDLCSKSKHLNIIYNIYKVIIIIFVSLFLLLEILKAIEFTSSNISSKTSLSSSR